MNRNDSACVVATINMYAFVVDAQQWDLFGRVFCSDVKADFGGGAVWQDLESLKRDFITIHTPFDSTQHITTNHVISIKDEQASCLSYVHGRFIRQVAEGDNLFECTGWYDDKLVFTESGWRIKERVCRTVWAGGNPLVLATMAGVTGEQLLDSLKVEAAMGRINFLNAIK